jgi:DNA-binding CsgD family transcriptional regulator
MTREMSTVGAGVIGRDEEVAAIASFLSSVGDGPAGILLTGEAGIGKTTLWEAGVEAGRERSFRVLVARPAEAEAKLSLAGVGDLLDPFLDNVLPLLPSPQRRALEVALLIVEAEGRAPDPRAVAVAFLGALRALARAGPVLLAVDDVQWLDAPSESVLRFAARRLRDEPVALLVTQRATGTTSVPLALDRALPSERFASIRVGPLALGAFHRILHDRLGVAFPRPILIRLLEASGGNPFFALEIARGLERSERRPLPAEPLPVPSTLDELVRDRVAALPADARDVLAVAAMLSQPRLSIVKAAIGDDAGSDLQPALRADVISLEGDRIRFAHPLLASAAYATADPLRRRELHRCLAEVVDDLEERARHLAAGADGTDSAVADVLAQAARWAQARGAPAAAAELAEKALHLTPPDQAEQALRRTMNAAAHHFEAGDPAHARRLLEDALAAAPPGPERAEVRTRLARVHAFEADLPRAAAFYRQALAEAADDSDTWVEAQAGLAVALMRMLTDLASAARHAREAAERAEQRGDPGMRSEFLGRQALIEGLLGRPGALERARQAAELERRAIDGGREYDYFLRLLGGAQFMLGVLQSWNDDVDGARASIDAARARAAELGDDSSLPLLLRWRTYASWLAGDWKNALRDAEAGYEAAIQNGQPSQQAVLTAVRGLVLAHLGRVSDAREAAQEGLRLAEETGATFGTMLGLSALGFLELSLGNAAEADRHLGPLVARIEAAGVREPGAARFVPDEIEALIVLGRLEEAEALLARLERRARRLDRASALAAAARCRGLLAAARGDLASAVSDLDVALAEHERVPMPFERARTLLVLGGVRRRAKRKRSAREALTASLALFDELGAELWAVKARSELGRIGGRGPAAEALTPTERRVAELVAEGRPTKVVAGELFVSVKTVEGHLSRIYAKLGVRSRAELAARFAAERPRLSRP